MTWPLYDNMFLSQYNDVALLPRHMTRSTTTLPYRRHGLSVV